MAELRYRLQRREKHVLPNILGGTSQPVHTWRWKDIAGSGNRALLEAELRKCSPPEMYRIIDTREAIAD